MVVHEVSTSKKLLKVVITNVEGNGQANGGPQGETTAHPVPEAKHVSLINAKRLHLGGVGGQGDEVLGHCGRLSEEEAISKYSQLYV